MSVIPPPLLMACISVPVALAVVLSSDSGVALLIISD
jgi:hypothetical protein